MSTPTATIQAAAEALTKATSSGTPLQALVGLDGFVDEIVRVVDVRHSVDRFEPIRTIGAYAARLAAAAGKSTNVEFVTQEIKLGGNGPLMASALGHLGARVQYVGAVGWPEMHPVFESLRRFGPVTTIAPPGITLAAEFDDGKIMHGRMEGLAEVTLENAVARLGGEAALDAALRGARLVSLINWTMVPHMTGVLRGMRERFVALGADAPCLAFFDLCDPVKRTVDDLRAALATIATFASPHTTAILGVNEKESEEVCRALDVELGPADPQGMIARAERLVRRLGVTEVVIHPTRFASAYGAAGSGTIDGPYCAAPRLTTGAGDHFNGGYAFARAMGLAPAHAVVVGKAVSGFYVRQAHGPTPAQIATFCKRWIDGSLDPWQGA